MLKICENCGIEYKGRTRCHTIHENKYSKIISIGDDAVITHVPQKTIEEFNKFAEEEFNGETGFAFKHLWDFRKGLLSDPNQLLAEQIECLAAEIEQLKAVPKESEKQTKKVIKSVSGRVIAEKKED